MELIYECDKCGWSGTKYELFHYEPMITDEDGWYEYSKCGHYLEEYYRYTYYMNR